MNLFKDEIEQELSRIKTNIDANQPMTFEDLKLILLEQLSEEDLHESNQ